MADIKPTAEQRAAIHYSNDLVAIAKPGSGKTFVMSRKVSAALDTLPEHRGIIAISYTNKSSNELRDRALGHGTAAKASFFGTIDRFCASEIIIPFLSQLWGTPDAAIEVLRIQDIADEESEGLDALRKRITSADIVERNRKALQDQFHNGRLVLETAGALALYTVEHSRACQRYLAARYSHIFIDEYQDSGEEQHGLFLAIRELGIVATAVGDADQSIFEFSNKDSKHLLSLARDPSFRSFPVTLNHRCHPSIVNYSLRLLNPQAAIIQADETRVFHKRCSGGVDSLASWIDSTVPTLMKKYEVGGLGEVGVLVRSGATGRALSEALSTRHRYLTPHPLENSFTLWARLFCQLLRYRWDTRATAQDILEANITQLASRDIRRIRKRINTIRTVEADKLFSTMEAIAEEMLPEARKDGPAKILHDSDPSELQSQFSPGRDDEMQVLTIHKAKGLEFDLVLHLDLHEWVFPRKRPGPGDDFNNPEFPSWDQDLNLHYVGITRARKACFICTCGRRVNGKGESKNARPSEFLDLAGLPALRGDWYD